MSRILSAVPISFAASFLAASFALALDGAPGPGEERAQVKVVVEEEIWEWKPPQAQPQQQQQAQQEPVQQEPMQQHAQRQHQDQQQVQPVQRQPGAADQETVGQGTEDE